MLSCRAFKKSLGGKRETHRDVEYLLSCSDILYKFYQVLQFSICILYILDLPLVQKNVYHFISARFIFFCSFAGAKKSARDFSVPRKV